MKSRALCPMTRGLWLLQHHHHDLFIFTARCIMQSAVLRLHVVCPSVYPSVCDVDGSGPHRLQILETNCMHGQLDQHHRSS